MPSPNPKQVDLVIKSLSRRDKISIRINGTCMTPLINDGATIQIRRRWFYLPGDIIVKRDSHQKLISHRFIGCYPWKGQWNYVTQADNADTADAAVYGSKIVGKVCGGNCAVTAYKVPFKSRIKSIWQFLSLVINRARLKIGY
jgi:hypothetical protein